VKIACVPPRRVKNSRRLKIGWLPSRLCFRVFLSEIGAQYLRTAVIYRTSEAPGTIVIDPQNHYLYFVEGGGQAIRYGVGVGREGFGWSGVATIQDKQEWPDWYPPKEMIQRQPELRRQMSELQGGLGMPGGPGNPLGSRAMYLWQGNKDTLYRIHGTVEPWTIGKSISSGCIRMINQDVIDLYMRAPLAAWRQGLGSSATRGLAAARSACALSSPGPRSETLIR
jgi:lipoprotein-anchoring transpeptidase ErfK/SrfK